MASEESEKEPVFSLEFLKQTLCAKCRFCGYVDVKGGVYCEAPAVYMGSLGTVKIICRHYKPKTEKWERK